MNLLINLLLSFSIGNAVELPKTLKELRNSAVMIVNKTFNSGGTGSVLKSSNEGSDILTNKHVCEVVKNGGFIIKEKLKAKVVSYKEYDKHDLCLIHVDNNLNVNLKLAPQKPEMSDVSTVSGFPRLMPNTITRGHFSDIILVQVMMGAEKCTDEEYLTILECMWFGFKPVVQTFQSQHTSNLIQPGNSGSAVFNGKGELSGVVFAGSGELAFALIVPFVYVSDFIKNQKKYEDVYPEEGTFEEIELHDLEEDMSAKCKAFIKPNRIKQLCKELKHTLLYRKK